MKFPERAQKAFAFLFRPYNDIDVYVEDTANRNVYEVLVNRILEGRAKVTRVFQLGGSDRVVAACMGDQAPSNRCRLYIIDGDLDLVLGRNPPPLRYLYRLAVYSSENLLLDEAAVVEIGYESDPNADRAEVARRLGVSKMYAELAPVLVPLFLTYASAAACSCGVPTSSVNVANMATRGSNGLDVDPQRVAARDADVRAASDSGRPGSRFDSARAQLELQWAATPDVMLAIVSGKTYLLPLVFHRLKSVTGYSGTLEQLKVRLARHANLNCEPGLKDAVVACATKRD